MASTTADSIDVDDCAVTNATCAPAVNARLSLAFNFWPKFPLSMHDDVNDEGAMCLFNECRMLIFESIDLFIYERSHTCTYQR